MKVMSLDLNKQTGEWEAVLDDGTVITTNDKQVLEDFLDFLENRNATNGNQN